MRKTWIYDLETLDIFTATFVDKDSDETKAFVIADSKDERLELFQFLDTEVQYIILHSMLLVFMVESYEV